MQRRAQLVAEHVFALGDKNLEETLGSEQLHLDGRRGFFGEIDDLASLRVAHERPHDHPLASSFFEGAHAQKIMGTSAAGFDEGGEFDGS